MSLAPIALFVYNRLEHTKKTISALKNNELAAESDLVIFSDAAKNESGTATVCELREYLKTVTGFKSIKIIERQENFGLAKSIISGVTEIVNQYGKIIVLEDDLITSKYFLKYLNQALDIYEKNKLVGSINSYLYPIGENLPETFFLRVSDSWGWATWSDRWCLFNQNAEELYKKIKSRGLSKKFDIDGSYPFFQMLKGQIKGLNNSWAIRWYASLFLLDKLNLYYGKSLVHNIGWDSGTHSNGVNVFKSNVYSSDIGNIEVVDNAQEDNIAIAKLRQYFRRPKMFFMVKLIFIRNNIRMFLIDLGLRKKKK